MMNFTKTISYCWFNDIPDQPINARQSEILEAYADEHISELIAQGCISGDMKKEIEGRNFTGRWNYQISTSSI